MPKEKQKVYKVTYFSPTKQRPCKKEFVTVSELRAFARDKRLKAYGVWKLQPSLCKAG